MFKNNKIMYSLLALIMGVAMSFSTVNAQVTGEEQGATQNSITGQVVDAATGQPLSDVTVKVEGQDVEATTDENGQFTLNNLQAGMPPAEAEEGGMGGEAEGGITLQIDHEGYESFSRTIQPDEIAQQGVEGEDLLTLELEPKEGGMEGDY